MKVSMVGLLQIAIRNLALLNELVEGKLDFEDLSDHMELVDPVPFLEQLIEHIEILQADPSKIDEFLNLYCIKKS